MMLISIIAMYPNRENEKDGMMQRIAAIDKIIDNYNRNYLEISFRRNFFYKKNIINNRVVHYKLNFFLHFFIIIYLCMKSKVVYVHSIYNSLKIILLYFLHKNIITDMHGIVPEELEMEKKKRAVVYKMVEKIVMKNGAFFITVTNNMKKHFTNKYNVNGDRFWILSIFSFTINRKKRYLNDTFIYSGNIQKWQCIDRLIPFIKETKNKYRWIVLSGAKDFFSERLDSSVVINSVKHNQVNDFYRKADFGVVLRENSIVNKVACPTKLIEYISNGLIPIVYDPEIGDFYQYGYRYLTMEDVYNGNIPDDDELNAIRKHNIGIINIINDNNKNTISKLYEFLNVG